MGEIITLKENREFRRIYLKGKSVVSSVIVTYAIRNRRMATRLGITASKKTGNAVLRNRSRRIILAAYRDLLPDIKSGYDLVFVARKKTPFVKSYDIRKQMKRHLEKLGVIGEKK